MPKKRAVRVPTSEQLYKTKPVCARCTVFCTSSYRAKNRSKPRTLAPSAPVVFLYSMLRRKLCSLSCFGLPSTSSGVPSSAMTP